MSWGNPQSFAEKALATALSPVSLAWGVGSYCRLMSYNLKLLKQKNLPVPVISIGNLTCGGTGKTPITIDLAYRLIKQNQKVAILSRGWQRKSRNDFLVVSDGYKLLTTCSDAGDEPYMIAQAVPQAVVIVGASRAASAEVALNEYGCNVILLDDGFQHLGIARSQDIVLIDYNDDLLNNRLFPAGSLREPLSALARADWVVITRVPVLEGNTEKLLKLRSLIVKHAFQAKISSCRFMPGRLEPFDCPGVSLNAATLAGSKIMAFCGIASPENFFLQLASLGADIVCKYKFPDHHWYNEQDVELLKVAFKACGAELLLTTEKDAVRLPKELLQNVPIAVLKLKVDWLGPVPFVEDIHSGNLSKNTSLEHSILAGQIIGSRST